MGPGLRTNVRWRLGLPRQDRNASAKVRSVLPRCEAPVTMTRWPTHHRAPAMALVKDGSPLPESQCAKNENRRSALALAHARLGERTRKGASKPKESRAPPPRSWSAEQQT